MAQGSAKAQSVQSYSLDNLTDVILSTPTTGQQLTYNGADWVNSNATGDMLQSVYDTDADGVVDSSEKEVVVVRNATGSTIPKGSVVYINGATGQVPTIALADADSEATSSKTIGLTLTAITNNTNGYIITSGLFHSLDTSAYADGDSLWLSSTAGGMVANTPPSEPAHSVYIGRVAYAHNTNGKIIVAIQNGYELDELHGVTITSATNGDVLTYNSTSGLWVNSQPATSSFPYVTAHEVFRGVVYANNSTTETTSGGITIATTGSATARSVATTNYATKQIRKGFVGSVVSSGRYTGTRGSALLWYMEGGFRYVCDFYVSDTAYASGCRQFYGMAGQTTDLGYSDTVLVSSLTNIIGVGSDAADANLQIFHNDASGTATKIDLGASFPSNRTAGAAMTTTYSVELYNASAGTSVKYRVINNETGVEATGTLTTDLPANTQGLNFFASRCMGGGGGLTNSGQFDLQILGVYSL